ncbi:secreted RxLR effector protein 161-like [Raphanus sativus]|uniref:Secreted RxLR effector protein 161-like n=1 Tax=Raphanus sativus TaxID=3726 RepID=A0A9W3D8V8_RAPSA|nr:secreted RxLR effector protein 161-like [Raphanus sativus]
MEILRDMTKKKLFLSQKAYIEKVLTRFGMLNVKLINTPWAANFHPTMSDEMTEGKTDYMSRVPYARAVGSLIYVIVCARSDLAHAVSVVSWFIVQPRKEHWMAVKRIFRYLKGTSDVGFVYGDKDPRLFIEYSDSDYVGDVDSMRSMTGYIFTLGGSVVSWKATLQLTVILSTTEAEYMALKEADKVVIWLRRLFSDLSLHHSKVIVFSFLL